MSLRNTYTGILLFLCAFFIFLVNVSPVKATACGGDCSVYGCDAVGAPYELSCVGSVCGEYYATCNAASTCILNGGWDTSAPCNSNDCTNIGSTRTSIYIYGACTANCGLNTKVGTCTDQAQNNCAQQDCTSPVVRSPGGTYSDNNCTCVSSNPVAPSSVTAVENDPAPYDYPTRIDVNWSFGAGADGCGLEWGYVCGARANTFSINIDGGAAELTGLAPATRAYTMTVGSWGAHSVVVCASNGFGTTCSASIPFTLTAPTCTVTGQSPTIGCYAAFPDLSGNIGNGADKIQYKVDNENTLTNPWTCDSGWISPVGGYTVCNPLVTDTYYWAAQSQSTNSPIKCTTSTLSPVYSLDVDVDPPGVPAPVITAVDCSGTVSVAWPIVNDVGCFAGVQYHLQTTDDLGGIYQNAWHTSPTTITNAPVIGRVYQAKALSSDNGASHTHQSAYSAGAMWSPGVPYCCPATPTLIPIGSTCNGPAFPDTYRWNSVAGAAGYNLTISKGATQCVNSIAVGNVTTYTLTPGQQAACDALGTGTYSWTIQAAYTGGCAPSSLSAAGSFDFDKTPPPIPVPTITFVTDATCPGKTFVDYSWKDITVDTGADVVLGCAGLNANPYWSQASVVPTPAFWDNVFPINTWGSYISQETSSSYIPGTTLNAHVQSRDVKDNQSAWSSTDTITIPTPSPYPTIHIGGTFMEDINRTCAPMTLVGPVVLNPIISVAPGVTPAVTPSCTTTATDYSCNFTVDNMQGDCVSPNVTILMDGTYTGYGTIGWRSGVGAAQCDGNPIPIAKTVGDPDLDKPIYFTYNTILSLTPGPTPPNASGWFKLSQTSFNSRQSSRQNYIPNNIQKFSVSDTDDSVVDRNIMIGSSGLLLQDGKLEPGANSHINGEVVYSTNNWYTSGYTSTNDINYSKYLEYLKARKDFNIISTTPLSAASFPTNGIYSVRGLADVTLDPTWFDGKTIVLIIENGKTALFSADFIPPNGGSVAILATKIDIDATVKEIDAILIGKTVTTGNSEVDGLKIKGNLIDEDVAGLTLGRNRPDATRPSLFVVFDPALYLKMLPYLSTSTYDWRQIQ